MSSTSTMAALTAGGVLAAGVAGAATAAGAAPAQAATTTAASVQAASGTQAKQARIRAMKQRLTTLPGGRKLPIRDYTVSSGWGHSSGPHAGREHAGIDLAARTGTPIYSATDGKVVLARPYYGYGNLVMVRTEAGSTLLYAHQSRITVKKGQRVQAGQQLGKVGSTGHSTGPHLHFEVRTKNDRATDPLRYLGVSRSYLVRLDHQLDRLR